MSSTKALKTAVTFLPLIRLYKSNSVFSGGNFDAHRTNFHLFIFAGDRRVCGGGVYAVRPNQPAAGKLNTPATRLARR